jgi:hypothetical protein
MLYLHCGWPKTGTTSLQGALARHQERLVDAGVIYPARWQRAAGRNDFSHNGLLSTLKPFQVSEDGLDKFKGFLGACAGRNVLLSSESLFLLLLCEGLQESLFALLTAAQEVMPVTCIWTLRRFDEVLRSFYLQLALRGEQLANPSEFIATFLTTNIFPGMRRVEDVLGQDGVTYVKYNSSGQHNADLLDALGLQSEACNVVCQDLRTTIRRNRSRSHKEVVAAIHIDLLSERSGLTLERRELLQAFDRGDFKFTGDAPCVIGEQGVRAAVHEKMLRSACDNGIEPYVLFFAGDEIATSPPSVSLEPEVLTDDDLSELALCLRR